MAKPRGQRRKKKNQNDKRGFAGFAVLPAVSAYPASPSHSSVGGGGQWSAVAVLASLCIWCSLKVPSSSSDRADEVKYLPSEINLVRNRVCEVFVFVLFSNPGFGSSAVVPCFCFS